MLHYYQIGEGRHQSKEYDFKLMKQKLGISFMKIDEKLDSGPVCNKYSIDIFEQDNTETLSEKLSYLSTEKILENVQKVLDGEAIFKEQDHAKATYAKKIQKKRER